MAGKHRIGVQFPLGGQFRGARYAQKTRPYSTPRASNVRGVGPLELRRRGGTRPGLEKAATTDFGTTITAVSSVTYIDGSGDRQQEIVVAADGTLYVVASGTGTATAAYLTINGDPLTINGNRLIFNSTVSGTNPNLDGNTFQTAEWNGRLYMADSSLVRYNPVTGTVDTVANAPTGQGLVCIYQERIVLAGEDNKWYMSRQSSETDWDAGDEMTDVGRAVFGSLARSGAIGEKIMAMKPYEDEALVFGCKDSVWVMQGNPAGDGRIRNVSRHMGVIGPEAMDITPNGLCVFLTRRGLYTWAVGSGAEPEPFSPEKLPESLLDVDVTTNDVFLKYDHRSGGVHVFVTPNTGTGSHFWVDLENRAFWPVEFGDDTHQPLATAVVTTAGYSDVVIGCKDGYLRRFDDDATDDDGTDITSDILLGPFHVSRAEGVDGQVAELVGALGAGSGAVTWKIVVADSAEECVDLAETALDGDGTTGVDDTGAWAAGQNGVCYPRSRGQWAILWLSSTAQWSYEAISMMNRRLGRLR